ncbi:MAG TPA: hypothetical protein VN711_01560 [Candidatus Saccharimonadales bacterium]|nr:hypothetical protein [Candidatus Saccharimonadales bacterium]
MNPQDSQTNPTPTFGPTVPPMTDPSHTPSIPTPFVLPNEPSQPPSRNTSSWGRSIILSLGVLSAGLAIAFGGFYLGQKSSTQQASPTPSVATTASATHAITPTPTPASSVSGQLVYIDPTYGISFSYPATWEVTHSPSLNGTWLRVVKKGVAENVSGPIVLEINPSTTGQAPLLKNYLSQNTGVTTQQITIGGEQGFFQTHANCDPFFCDIYIFGHQTTAFLLMSFTPTTESDQQTTFDLIAHTFTFTK